MINCLITKLKGTVNNSNIPKIGELIIGIKVTGKDRFISLESEIGQIVTIYGDSYFMNSSNQKEGSTLGIGTMSMNSYVADKNGTMSFPNKYAIKKIQGDVFEDTDISELAFNDSLQILVSDAFYGDLKHLSNKTGLVEINLSNKATSGDIAALKPCTKVSKIFLSSSAIYGDISCFYAASALNQLTIDEAKLTGDISLLPSGLLYFRSHNGKSIFTWDNERKADSSIIGLYNINLGNDVDKMLINQAKCTVKELGDNPSWFRAIIVFGTRTSASDEAITTLQGKGYTVSVNPA